MDDFNDLIDSFIFAGIVVGGSILIIAIPYILANLVSLLLFGRWLSG